MILSEQDKKKDEHTVKFLEIKFTMDGRMDCFDISFNTSAVYASPFLHEL